MAIAMAWAARITTVSLEMVLPIVAGYWLDQWAGTRVVFTIVGAALGMSLGMRQLIAFTRPRPTDDEGRPDTQSRPPEN